MKEPNTSENQSFTKPSANHLGRKLLYTLIVLALMVASSYTTYIWQQGQVKSLGSSLEGNKEKVNFLTKQQNGLNGQIATLSTKNLELSQKSTTEEMNIAEPTIKPVTATLKLDIIGARKYPESTDPATKRAIIIDISINNTSSDNINLLISDFQLRDEFNNTSYNYGAFSGQTMSNGNVVLDSRVVAPGETVTGAMAFSTLNVPVGYFTLEYKSQTYPITLE